MQYGRFPCKIKLRLKKVCYKVSLYENRQRQSFKAFIGLLLLIIIIIIVKKNLTVYNAF